MRQNIWDFFMRQKVAYLPTVYTSWKIEKSLSKPISNFWQRSESALTCCASFGKLYVKTFFTQLKLNSDPGTKNVPWNKKILPRGDDLCSLERLCSENTSLISFKGGNSTHFCCYGSIIEDELFPANITAARNALLFNLLSILTAFLWPTGLVANPSFYYYRGWRRPFGVARWSMLSNF